MKKIIVEGHRGYCSKYPENTMISFAAAIEIGVDAIEFDVHLTADKVPVLMHDANAVRTCGVNRALKDMTLAEVKALDASYPEKFGSAYQNQGVTVPTLEELLAYCQKTRPDLILGVEIKAYTEENVDLTVALLKKYGFFDRCCFYAFNGRILRYIKNRYGGCTMGYPDFLMAEFTPGGYENYCEIGLSMNVLRSEVSPIFLQKGFPVHAYCADTEEAVDFCIEKGASLITANDPVPLLCRLGRLCEK